MDTIWIDAIVVFGGILLLRWFVLSAVGHIFGDKAKNWVAELGERREDESPPQDNLAEDIMETFFPGELKDDWVSDQRPDVHHPFKKAFKE